MFGVEEKEIWPTIGGHTVIYVIILLVVFMGLIAAFKSEVSPFAGERAADGTPISEEEAAEGKNVQGEVLKTITHPRLLAALFILIVSAFTIKLLIDKVETK